MEPINLTKQITPMSLLLHLDCKRCNPSHVIHSLAHKNQPDTTRIDNEALRLFADGNYRFVVLKPNSELSKKWHSFCVTFADGKQFIFQYFRQWQWDFSAFWPKVLKMTKNRNSLAWSFQGEQPRLKITSRIATQKKFTSNSVIYERDFFSLSLMNIAQSYF